MTPESERAADVAEQDFNCRQDRKWTETNTIAGTLWLDSGGQPTTLEQEKEFWRQAEEIVEEAHELEPAPQPETLIEGNVTIVEENVIKPDITIY